MERYGLVLEGGGVRGAYTAGALAWLNDNGISFDYSVGISSGAVYLCCYLMHDNKTSYMMSAHYAADPSVVGVQALLRSGYYVDYEKIFDEFLRGREGMTLQPLIDENPDMEVGVYDLSQGKTVFLGPKDLDPDLKLLRGTCALPVASAVVEYNGHRVLDGGITKMIPIERALEKGCTKFMVITTKPADYVRKPASPIVKAMMKYLYRECPQAAKDYEVRHLNYYKQIGLVNSLAEEGKAIHVYPSRTIKASRWKADEKNTEALYALGYSDMEARAEEIKAFMADKGKD